MGYFSARKIKKKRYSKSVFGDVTIGVVLILFGAFMFLPFVYAMVQSLKPMEELFLFPPRFYVKNPTFDNFYQLFQLTNNLWVPFERYVFNSVFVTVIGTFANVVFSSMAAFPLAKFRFPGSKLLSNIVVLALLFVYEVTYIPQYIVMSKLGIIDSYWAILLPAIATPLGLYLMRQFMTQLPDSMIESATVDGAGLFRTYWSIIMPNCKPAWFTLIIFSFQSIWNRDSLNLIYSEDLKVLPTIFKQISSSSFARVGVSSAAAVLLMIPPILIFIISQSKVLETMAFSGIKE